MADQKTESSSSTIELSTSDVVNALLHARQSEHHYATQESVDNLKEQNKQQFEHVDKQFEQVDKQFEQIRHETKLQFDQVDKRFEQVDKRFEQMTGTMLLIDKKLDRLHWFIVAIAIAAVFKDNILAFFA